MRKSISSKRVRGGAVPTRRAMSLRSSGRRSMGHRSSSRRSASASMSKKMLIVSKYMTLLNKLAETKAIKKNDAVAGYILVPFVDSYSDTIKYSRTVSQYQSRRRTGGAGPARAASIADEPEAYTPSEQDLIDLLTRHGRAVLGVHGPCWWHRINHYERLQFMRRCNPEIAAQLRRNTVVDFLCSLPEARGSRTHVEACMQAANDNQNLAFRYLEHGIPARAAAASVSRPPPVALSLPPECVGQVYVSRRARFEYANPGELDRAMDYFAGQYQSYCQLVHKTVPGGLTGAQLTGIVREALGNASALDPTTEQFRIPARFESPDTRLTFCEYAAILFFTRDHSRKPFSSYLMMNSTMNYLAVKDLSAVEYVQRIRHPFVMLFYFALYKCPRIRDIKRTGLIPVGMRYLHRFMTIDAGFFQNYRSLPVANLVTFYCFQSFSFTLSYNNVDSFTTYSQNRDHLVLLRIEINDATSARLMAHFSDLIYENEAVVTPCVPYTVVGVQEFPTSAGFQQEITAGSGYTHLHEFSNRFRGFLVVTIREEKYRESMSGRADVLRG